MEIGNPIRRFTIWPKETPVPVSPQPEPAAEPEPSTVPKPQRETEETPA